MTHATRAPSPLPVLDPEAALEADAAEMHQALSELVRVYQFRDRDRICCHDISVTQCHALEVVVREGPISLNALAASLYLDKSTASRVVATLERKGYLLREADAADRRALRIAATGAGEALYRVIDRELVDQEKRLLADFSPDVRRGMARLLRQIAGAARARITTIGGSCCVVD